MEQRPPQSLQGELFEVLVESSGTTDPATPRTVTAHFIEQADGHFPQVPEFQVTEPGPSDISQAVHKEVITRKHHLEQLGKHSPLQRDGTYLAVGPGDVLPGFGIVTRTNLANAQAHAAQLEAARTSR